jgi:2-polyprenyl-6-methoxyphenol hydroxylase-like FAD-dependent oxidoreductase
MNARWEVVVVGARVAGASTALLLARSGLRVLCLERARPGSDTVSGVVTRDRQGRVHTERAGLVVGADGRESLVAGAVAAEVLVAGRASSAFVYGYWADLPSDGYEWFYRSGSSAGTIPTNDGLTCVFVGARLAAAERVGALRHVRGRPAVLRRCAEVELLAGLPVAA